jgi:hypothetical protein
MHSSDPIAEEIVRLAEARSAALVGKDLAAMDRLLADTFRYTNASGIVLTKGEYFEHYVESSHVRWAEQAMDEVAVTVYGQAAVLTCRVRDVGQYGEQPFDVFYRSTFLWVRDNGAWRCAAGHTSATERPAATSDAPAAA